MSETYSFDVAASVDKARASIDSFAKDTQAQLSGINFATASTAIIEGLKLVGGVADKVFGAIKDGIEASIQAASEAEKAQTQLANAMKITGDYSAAAADQFADFAEQLSRSTTFSETQIIQAGALAKQFGLTNDQAEQLVKTATNLAAIQGTDLNTATKTLADTYSGFVDRGIKKVIPALQQLSLAQLANGDAIDLVNQKTQNSAAVLGDTFGGSITKAANAFEELEIAIGNLAVKNPVVIQGIQAVEKAIEAATDAVKANTPEFKKIVTDGFLLIIGSVPILVEAIEAVDFAFSASITTAKLFVYTMTSLPADTAQAAVGVKAAAQRIKDAFSSITNPAGFADRAKIYGPLIDGAKDLAKQVNAIATSSANQQVITTQNKTAAQIDAERKAALQIDLIYQKQLQDSKDAQQKIIDLASKSIQNSIAKPFQIAVDFASSGSDAFVKTFDEIDKSVKKIASDAKFDPQLKSQVQEFADNVKAAFTNLNLTGVGIGVVNSILKGAQGAQDAISSVIGTALSKTIANGLTSSIGGKGISDLLGFSGISSEFADAIAPGIGQIVSVLAQGPDAVKGLVDSFADAIPSIIKNIAQAAPVLVEEIAKKAPEIVKAIVAELPELINGLVAAIPQVAVALAAEMPEVAIAFVEGLIKGLPDILKGLADGFLEIPKQFLDAILNLIPGGKALEGGGSGGGLLGNIPIIGGALNGVGSVLSNIPVVGGILGGLFADGGRVPLNPAYAGDRFPAKLSAGEQVLAPDLTSKLENFLNGGGGSGQQTVVIQIGQQELARVLLNINRGGFRTS